MYLLASDSFVNNIASCLGTHAPYFCNGGEPQFSMMNGEGFMYDYTQTTRQYGYLNMEDGAWPFTADYW